MEHFFLMALLSHVMANNLATDLCGFVCVCELLTGAGNLEVIMPRTFDMLRHRCLRNANGRHHHPRGSGSVDNRTDWRKRASLGADGGVRRSCWPLSFVIGDEIALRLEGRS